MDDLRAPFAQGLRPVHSTTELWPLLLLLAILLFPLDVGLRRVSVSRLEMARALGELRRRLGIGVRPKPVGVPAPATQMQSLFSAKERVRERAMGASTPRRAAPPVIVPEPPELGAEAVQAQELQSTQGEVEEPARATAPTRPHPARKIDEQPEETLAARLRRARERR